MTSSGNLVFHLFSALAEFERDIIRERTQAGLEVARARGRKEGPPAAMDSRKRLMAEALYSDNSHSISDICKALKISRTTFYKYIDLKRKKI